MKKYIYFIPGSEAPNFPITAGLVIYLFLKQFPNIPDWLLGIIWFVYIVYFIGVLYLRATGKYIKPFDGELTKEEITSNSKFTPLDDKIGRALLQNEKV